MKDKSILDILQENQSNTVIDVNTKFCDLNIGKSGSSKTLGNEPGIPELEALYFDVYDYNTGKFSSMSNDMIKQYNKDLQEFYTLFTGKKSVPPEIKKFSQIPLRDYNTSKPCASNGVFRKTYRGTLKEKLFKEYAENIQSMMKNTKDNQKSLLGIIDQLFVFTKDPQDPNKKVIVINPKLDNALLSKVILEARQIIVKLYSTCEKDFFKGLQIFEAIVEKQIMDTSVAQIKKLQTNVEETISLEPTESSTVVDNAIEASVELPPQQSQPVEQPIQQPQQVQQPIQQPIQQPQPEQPQPEQPEQPQAQQPEQPQAQQQPVVQQRNNDIMNAVVTV